MEITLNTTFLRAESGCAVDALGRDHCVVVVQGTFLAEADGRLRLAGQQRPPASVDEHYGDPATTSLHRECDFALGKPQVDVLVAGQAVSPGGRPATHVGVCLEGPGRAKRLTVVGDQHWDRGWRGWRASEPTPFTSLPLVYERAWGGQDDSKGPESIQTEPTNPLGVGYHPLREAAAIVGRPLPNVRRAEESPFESPREPRSTAGMAAIARHWQPRLGWAGTYDEIWRTQHAPLLPPDFDQRFHQSAPMDQQWPSLRGGETFCCTHLAMEPQVVYQIPAWRPPVRFHFDARKTEVHAVLDTIVFEPHLARASLTYRASIPLGKKLTLLREIEVGVRRTRPFPAPVAYRRGKPHFEGLGDAVAWLSLRRRPR